MAVIAIFEPQVSFKKITKKKGYLLSLQNTYSLLKDALVFCLGHFKRKKQ